ncbi:MAG: translation elongation factor Ts [Bacilli bacterium]
MVSANDVKQLREKTGAGMLDCKKALIETNGDFDKATDWLREKGISTANKKASRIATEGLINIETNGNIAVMVEVNAETDFVSKNEGFINLINKITNVVLNNEVINMDEALAINVDNGTLNDLIVSTIAKIGEKISFRRFEKLIKQDNEIFGVYLHMGGRIGVITVIQNGDKEVAKDIAMHIAAIKPKYISKEEIPSEEIEKEKKILREQALNEGKPEAIIDKMVEGRISKYYKEVCLLDQPFFKDGDINVNQYLSSKEVTVKKFIRFELGEGLEKREDNFAEEVMKQINN